MEENKIAPQKDYGFIYDLKDLRELPEVGGHPIVVMDQLREKFPERFTEAGAMDHVWFESTIRPLHSVYIREDKNSISFTIKDEKVDGCGPEALVDAARAILETVDLHTFSNAYGSRKSALWHLRKAGEAIAKMNILGAEE